MYTFFSNAMSRTVTLEDLESINPTTLCEFHAELKQVVSSLDDVITTAKNKEKATGIAVNSDWLHKVNHKKRIALKFAAEVHSRLNGGSAAEQREQYKRIYKQQLRLAMIEEFGEAELAEFEKEVLDKAKDLYHAWVKETDQGLWFVP
jgi:hypothetical protein